jgi:hypothetical protein
MCWNIIIQYTYTAANLNHQKATGYHCFVFLDGRQLNIPRSGPKIGKSGRGGGGRAAYHVAEHHLVYLHSYELCIIKRSLFSAFIPLPILNTVKATPK